MNKFKNFINKYIKYKNQKNNKNKDNGIISYCIQNAYQKIIKLPFYKNPTFIYSDFDDSDIEKIIIEIYHYDYVFLHIYFYEEDDDYEKKDLKLYLYMYDEKILNKNIITKYDLYKYKYMKIFQKYLFYMIHGLFYSIYAYYIIQLLCGIQISIKNIFMIHFFHFFSEVSLLSFL
jgi:hypothetical protein